MATVARQLRSLITEDAVLRLSIEETQIPDPAPHEVLVRVEAAPINPSDIGLLFGPADMSSARFSGTAESPIVEADVPQSAMGMVAGRTGQSLPVGNEGAGVVIAAGNAPEAQALLGKTVGMVGGEFYAEYRCIPAAMCLPLEEGATAESGASCFVNPMTALAMTEVMRMEGHSGLIHTAAASNLGQMLNKICVADDIPLVNVVRKEEHVMLLQDIGATVVVNSGRNSFRTDLKAAIEATGATLAFDAIGGGRLVSELFSAMEAVAVTKMDEYSRYGSTTYKQIYIYGGLDPDPTTLRRNFGFSWGLGGFLLPNFLARAGDDVVNRMRARVAAELSTTFKSTYSNRVSLANALAPEAVSAYIKRATGSKFLLLPQS